MAAVARRDGRNWSRSPRCPCSLTFTHDHAPRAAHYTVQAQLTVVATHCTSDPSSDTDKTHTPVEKTKRGTSLRSHFPCARAAITAHHSLRLRLSAIQHRTSLSTTVIQHRTSFSKHITPTAHQSLKLRHITLSDYGTPLPQTTAHHSQFSQHITLSDYVAVVRDGSLLGAPCPNCCER